MKKVILAAAIIAMLGGLASCNKKCSCEASGFGVSAKTEEFSLKEFNDKAGTNYKKCGDIADVKIGPLSYKCK